MTVCFVFSVLLKVKMSLDSLLDSLVSLSDVGDCVARVEHLMKELKFLEEKAQVGSAPHILYGQIDVGTVLFDATEAFSVSSESFVPSSPQWKRPSSTLCTGTS